VTGNQNTPHIHFNLVKVCLLKSNQYKWADVNGIDLATNWLLAHNLNDRAKQHSIKLPTYRRRYIQFLTKIGIIETFG
jgi:hypothetical protein